MKKNLSLVGFLSSYLFVSPLIAETTFTGTQLPVGIGIASPSSDFVLQIGKGFTDYNQVVTRIDNLSTLNGFAILANAASTGNSNIGLAVGGTPKGIIGYDVGRGFLGFLNAAYSLNDFSLRLYNDGSLEFVDPISGTKAFRVGKTGLVEATEIYVQANIPDYVFAPNYNLPSLEEIEAHIKEVGHLPNVPSHQELEKFGGNIPLSLITTKTLEKVEELTLHLISMNKELELIKEENAQLKSEVKSISVAKE